MYVYLIINGYDITASQQDVENLIINVAAGNITNTELAYWLKVNTKEIRVIGQKVCVTNPNKLENL